MAGPDLKQADFDLAFTFSRSEAAPWRDGNGDEQTAAIDAPRFDHDEDGAPLGFLVGGGAGWGGGDRTAIDPLILPEAVLTAEATVLHAMIPAGAAAIEYRAYYSRHPQATIDALMRQQGHHRQLGVIGGFMRNVDGFAIYNGTHWRLPGLVGDGGGRALLHGEDGRPLIVSGVATAG